MTREFNRPPQHLRLPINCRCAEADLAVMAADDPERRLLAAIADIAWPAVTSGPLYEGDRPALRAALAQIRALLDRAGEAMS